MAGPAGAVAGMDNATSDGYKSIVVCLENPLTPGNHSINRRVA